MKLRPREFDAELKRGRLPAPVVLLYGPDGGLVDARARRLLELAAGGQEDPFRTTVLEGERLAREPHLLAEAALALTLTGEERIVRVREADDRTAPAVELLLKGPRPAARLVVLEAGDLPPRSRLRRLCEEATGAAACPCYREEGRELARTVGELLAAEGLVAEPGVVEWLTAHLGADHGITRREIEKLALYLADRPEPRRVRLEDVEAVVTDAAASGGDRLVLAVLGGRVDEVAALSERLEAAGEQPVQLLRLLGRELLRLWRLAVEVAAGRPPREVVAGARPPVFFRLRPLYERVLAQSEPAQLARALARLQAAELACKQTGAPDRLIARRALLELARTLAGEAGR